jgi:hypothetical protein
MAESGSEGPPPGYFAQRNSHFVNEQLVSSGIEPRFLDEVYTADGAVQLLQAVFLSQSRDLFAAQQTILQHTETISNLTHQVDGLSSANAATLAMLQQMLSGQSVKGSPTTVSSGGRPETNPFAAAADAPPPIHVTVRPQQQQQQQHQSASSAAGGGMSLGGGIAATPAAHRQPPFSSADEGVPFGSSISGTPAAYQPPGRISTGGGAAFRQQQQPVPQQAFIPGAGGGVVFHQHQQQQSYSTGGAAAEAFRQAPHEPGPQAYGAHGLPVQSPYQHALSSGFVRPPSPAAAADTTADAPQQTAPDDYRALEVALRALTTRLGNVAKYTSTTAVSAWQTQVMAAIGRVPPQLLSLISPADVASAVVGCLADDKTDKAVQQAVRSDARLSVPTTVGDVFEALAAAFPTSEALLVTQLQTMQQAEGTTAASHLGRIIQAYNKHRVPLPDTYTACLAVVPRFRSMVAEQLYLSLRILDMRGPVTMSDLLRACDDLDTLAASRAQQESMQRRAAEQPSKQQQQQPRQQSQQQQQLPQQPQHNGGGQRANSYNGGNNSHHNSSSGNSYGNNNNYNNNSNSNNRDNSYGNSNRYNTNRRGGGGEQQHNGVHASLGMGGDTAEPPIRIAALLRNPSPVTAAPSEQQHAALGAALMAAGPMRPFPNSGSAGSSSSGSSSDGPEPLLAAVQSDASAAVDDTLTDWQLDALQAGLDLVSQMPEQDPVGQGAAILSGLSASSAIRHQPQSVPASGDGGDSGTGLSQPLISHLTGGRRRPPRAEPVVPGPGAPAAATAQNSSQQQRSTSRLHHVLGKAPLGMSVEDLAVVIADPAHARFRGALEVLWKLLHPEVAMPPQQLAALQIRAGFSGGEGHSSLPASASADPPAAAGSGSSSGGGVSGSSGSSSSSSISSSSTIPGSGGGGDRLPRAAVAQQDGGLAQYKAAVQHETVVYKSCDQVTVTGDFNGRLVDLTIDSGATYSVVSQEWLVANWHLVFHRGSSAQLAKLRKPTSVGGFIKGTSAQVDLVVRNAVIGLGDGAFPVTFQVVPGAAFSLTLGLDFLWAYAARLVPRSLSDRTLGAQLVVPVPQQFRKKGVPTPPTPSWWNQRRNSGEPYVPMCYVKARYTVHTECVPVEIVHPSYLASL